MTERASVSRSGHPTLNLNGINLHSHYDPRKEAARFVDARCSNGKTPGTVIVLGEGLGYISAYVGERFPAAKLMAVFYSTAVFSQSFCVPEIVWHPDMETDIKRFFEQALDETDSGALVVLEWQPSAAMFPALAHAAHDALDQVLREVRGNIVTSQAMGKLWIRNSIVNFVSLPDVFEFAALQQPKPVLVIGSGPSSESAAEFIIRRRRDLFIIALPSASSFLASHETEPDVIVVTDPGYYSIVHILGTRNPDTIVCMPLSAARGIWNSGLKPSLLVQPYFFETDLLAGINGRFPVIHPQGTVAATAIQLALMLSQYRVVVTGLDFCTQDIRVHVRPNAFERMLASDTGRTNPIDNVLFQRAMVFADKRTGTPGCRTSLPLMTYAGWFNHLAPEQFSRIVQLHPSPAGLNKTAEVSETELESFIDRTRARSNGQMFVRCGGFPDIHERKRIVRRTIAGWQETLAHARRAATGTEANPLLHDTKVSDMISIMEPDRHLRIARLHREGSFALMIETFVDTVDDASACIDRLAERYAAIV